jgi:hypothetical protein
MKPLLLIAPILACLIGCGKSSPPHSTPTMAPQTNEPSVPKPVPELGEVFCVGEYAIQMPIGYELQSQDQRGDMHVTSWVLPAGEPPTGHRLFSVMIIQVPEGKSAPIANKLRTRPRPETGLIDYAETEPEIVPIGDWNFECVTTTCRAARTGRLLRGFQYVYVGRPCFVIVYQGAKEDEESFAAAQAAARTFRRR